MSEALRLAATWGVLYVRDFCLRSIAPFDWPASTWSTPTGQWCGAINLGGVAPLLNGNPILPFCGSLLTRVSPHKSRPLTIATDRNQPAHFRGKSFKDWMRQVS